MLKIDVDVTAVEKMMVRSRAIARTVHGDEFLFRLDRLIENSGLHDAAGSLLHKDGVTLLFDVTDDFRSLVEEFEAKSGMPVS